MSAAKRYKKTLFHATANKPLHKRDEDSRLFSAVPLCLTVARPLISVKQQKPSVTGEPVRAYLAFAVGSATPGGVIHRFAYRLTPTDGSLRCSAVLRPFTVFMGLFYRIFGHLSIAFFPRENIFPFGTKFMKTPLSFCTLCTMVFARFARCINESCNVGTGDSPICGRKEPPERRLRGHPPKWPPAFYLQGFRGS